MGEKVKIKISTDVPIEWNRKTREKELIFDTSKDHGEDPQTLFTGLVISAMSPMWYGNCRKVTIEVLGDQNE